MVPQGARMSLVVLEGQRSGFDADAREREARILDAVRDVGFGLATRFTSADEALAALLAARLLRFRSPEMTARWIEVAGKFLGHENLEGRWRECFAARDPSRFRVSLERRMRRPGK